jgi:hypothetical protein
VFAGERVLHHHWHVRCVCRLAGSGPDAVKHDVHAAESRHAIDQLNAAKLLRVKKRELLLVEFVVIANVVVSNKQETAGAACGIANCKWLSAFGRLRLHDIDNCADQRTRREVLTGTAFHVLRVLLQEPFVSVAFDVGIERRPFFLVDQVSDQSAQLGRVLDLVLRLSKDNTDQSRFFAQLFQRVAIMNLQFIAVTLQ